MRNPHWKSLLEVGLPQACASLTGIDFVAAFTHHLGLMPDYDFYEFQKLPFWEECQKYMQQLVDHRVPVSQAMNIGRMISEEAYAVLSFEHAGRRILKPSKELAIELLNTDVTVPINEILPPFPSCYIELPPGSGFQMEHETGMATVLGIYCTWDKTHQESRHDRAAFERDGILRCPDGLIRRCASDAEREIAKTQKDLPSLDTMFGDHFARFNIISEGPPDQPKNMHNFTASFFNMHWLDSYTEDAEDLFERFVPHWKKSTKTKTDFDRMVQAFHLAANLFVYMSSPQYYGEVKHTPNPLLKELECELKKSKNRRNLKRTGKLESMMLGEVYEIGQNVEIVGNKAISSDDTGVDDSESGDRLSPKTHWRRAHWRRVHLKRDGVDVTEWRRFARVLVKGRGPAPTSTVYEIKHAKSPGIKAGTDAPQGTQD